MPTYAIRYEKTKAIAGVLRARDPSWLFYLIDHDCNPHQFEYARYPVRDIRTAFSPFWADEIPEKEWKAFTRGDLEAAYPPSHKSI